MRRAGWLIGIVLVAGLCWRFPPFHIVSLEQAKKEKAAATFNPTDFTETFWNEKLLKSLNQAVPADVLLPMIATNSVAARQMFGRSVGVSESYSYFVSGRGRVLEVTEDEIALAVSDNAANAEISLQVGLLFSSVVRDGTGLLRVSDYPNSQDYNAISEALNRIIEERVQPRLREQAKVDAMVRFVGCAEVNDESTDLQPLKVVPIQAETQ